MNDQYAELYSTYQWFVPSQFNIAQVCLHRWAENSHEGRRPAIFFEDANGQADTWSYSRLAETSNRLANGLIRMGVQPGDRVAVVMEQRPELAAAYMAAFSVGAIVVPLTAQYGPDGLGMRLRDAGSRVAIVDAACGPDLLQAQVRCPALSQIIGLGFQHESIIPWRSLLARQPDTFKPLPTRSDSPALLLYTSGTTDAAPKGVLHAHSALIGNLPGFVASQNWFPLPMDVFWTPADWTWAAGLMGGLLPTLYFGHPIVATNARFSAPHAFELMERYRVTNTFLFPAAIKLMIQEVHAPREHYHLSLRGITVAGENVGSHLISWCRQALGITPNEAFGQTEANYVVGNSFVKWPAVAGSLGRPYPGHLVTVLDESERPCPAGVVGEICVNRYDIQGHRDPALFLGYWNDDDATRARFRGDWYLTGDLGYVDRQGDFWHVGRREDVFLSNGHLVSPGLIENCLMTHPAVANVAVVPKPDTSRGAYIKAYVVLAEAWRGAEREALEQTLQEHVRTGLSAQSTPREITFTDALPISSTGKIRRHVLRQREEQHKAETSTHRP